MGVVYEPVFDYHATAGVGQFNGSYVSDYIRNLQNREVGYPYTVVPYWMQAIVKNLVTSPCIRFPVYLYQSLRALGMTIGNVSPIQLDLRSEISQEDLFSNDDYNIYGAETSWVGIRVCVSRSQTVNDSIAAGLFVCVGGAWNVFSRKTTFIAARSNMSIMSVIISSPPTQNPSLDLEGFRAAITWMLHFKAANIPGPTSIAQQFFSGEGHLQRTCCSPILIQTFHSILAFPFWFFNPKNLGIIE
ncbi:hypothetical protein BDV12DRAFT_193554 [Aspergillus spectabilis]